jgi:hypothetical protein
MSRLARQTSPNSSAAQARFGNKNSNTPAIAQSAMKTGHLWAPAKTVSTTAEKEDG